MGFRSYHGNTFSENGWPICDVNECALPVTAVPFRNAAWIRRGTPLVILSAWLKYYHLYCAPVVSTIWGFSWDNDVDDSNHLSGTAVDVNAPQWPWGQRRMPADLKARIRRGLEMFEGTVFWGADWDRADEMHFQMNLAPEDLRNSVFANKLKGGYMALLAHDSPPLDTDDKDVLDMTVDELKSVIYDCLKTYVGPIGSDVKDIREQLTGGRDLIRHPDGSIDVAASYPGWSDILGTKIDGSGRTVTDAVGELLAPSPHTSQGSES